MPVERAIYKTPFHKGKQPQWLCPHCEKGVLRGIKGTFFYKETTQSKKTRDEWGDNWEIDWLEYVYSCSLSCTNPHCEETVASVGTGSVGYDAYIDETTGKSTDSGFYDYFQPKYFWPPLKIFDVPKNTPSPIKEEIEKSFELFFANQSSSSNHVRIALEKILDHLKINRYEVKNKKRILISLHKRILLLAASKADLKDFLFAIKWLGNYGSHMPDVTVDDVMDAYDILEVVLSELFEKKTNNIKKLAKRINKKRGPQKIGR